ncbi:hypothetical protein JTE90_005519 [Oedothorax gibbosus]|uniref:CWF21 domain-containing protein n=1 Tax=Oedothorax gibbosus TaxID=931172 RepID=A0AAV6UV37_9ARAC|nr:hypothetical protein JTE90_005519 [Oedothorax gibbosus]
MYNGIGLVTPRGSGTNGYVQRNMAFVQKSKEKVSYKTEEDIKRLDAMSNRKPNQGILAHERKRTIELKCLEMQELMEDEGYPEDEIETKVAMFRQMLVDKEGAGEKEIPKDEFGRPLQQSAYVTTSAAGRYKRILSPLPPLGGGENRKVCGRGLPRGVYGIDLPRVPSMGRRACCCCGILFREMRGSFSTVWWSPLLPDAALANGALVGGAYILQAQCVLAYTQVRRSWSLRYDAYFGWPRGGTMSWSDLKGIRSKVCKKAQHVV